MPYKRPAFILSHWLRFGGRWRSPYHRIAYELAAPKHASIVGHLLDYGFVMRASELLLRNPALSTPSSEAKLAFLTGKHDLARKLLQEALENPPADPRELHRIVKLLTRLSPNPVIAWARKSGNPQLAAQIEAAMAPPGTADIQSFQPPQDDEHLLVANATSDPEAKLAQLNAYFREMGLGSVALMDSTSPFDINNLYTPTPPLESKTVPKVSVIMTVHNGETYVRSAALSMLRQIGVMVELIVIDDGSTDGTWNVISELGREYPDRMICERLPENIGTYKAKNIALSLCTGKYVAFQDADDWSHPQRLARSVAWLQSGTRRIAITCRYVRLDTNAWFHSPAVWPLRQWSPNTLVFRRKPVITELGGFDEVKAGADTEYFERIRMHFGDDRIVFTKAVMLIAMSLPASLMNSDATGTDKMGYSAVRISYREKRSEEFLYAINNGKVLKVPL